MVIADHDYLSTGKVAMLCASLESLFVVEDADSASYDYVEKLQKPMLDLDNVRLNFRPLDCSYTDSYFIRKEKYGLAATFDDNCVDFEAGDDKPQIRVANTFTYFNITNFAYFENIEFTGEDLFATFAGSGTSSIADFGDENRWGPLAFLPRTKCRVRKEPSGFFDKLDLESISYFPALNNAYVDCSDNWIV